MISPRNSRQVVEIGIASHGDPFSRSTWSGTPNNIAKHLETAGASVTGINARYLSSFETALCFGHYQAQRMVNSFPLTYSRLKEDSALISSDAKYDFNQARWARMMRSRRLLKEVEARSVTDLVHMGPLAVPLTPIPGPCRHYLFWDTTGHSMRKNVAERRFPGKIAAELDALDRLALSNITHFFVTAEYVSQELRNYYGVPAQSISVVGTGPGGIGPYYGPKDYSVPRLLFVARQRFEDKGGGLLLRAFKLAHEKCPNLQLIIAGRDEYVTTLSGIPGVIPMGNVAFDTLTGLFQHANLFAMPALWEPWGLVYIEALLSRLPIIALYRNAIPDITSNGRFGFLSRSATDVDVAEAILRASDNLGLTETLGWEGQEYCLRQFTWSRVATQIVSVIRSYQQGGVPQI